MQLHSITIADPPLRSSYGLHAPYALRTIVELKTDDGVTGVSETYGGDGPVAALEAVRARITGMDPFQLAGLYQQMNQTVADAGDRSQTSPVKIRSTSTPGRLPPSKSRASTSSAKLPANLCVTSSAAWATIAAKTNMVKSSTPRPPSAKPDK